ncbi:aryl-sulfate sulfotransferase [Ligilactobacillus sp. LYQ135]
MRKNKLRLIFTVLLVIGGWIAFQGRTEASSSKTLKNKKWNIENLVKADGIVQKLNYDELNLKNISNIYNTEVQSKIEQQLTDLKSKQAYSLENPLVVSNPYLTNTTGLYVYFKTNEDVKVSYTIKAKGYATYSNTLYNPNGTYAKEHEYQIIGAVGGVKNTITLTATTKDGKKTTKTFTYTAPKLQSTVSNTYKVKNGKSKQKMTSGLFAVIGNQASTTVRSTYYVDNNGVVRGEIPLISYNSERFIMTDDKQMYFVAGAGEIAKMNRLGKITQVINVEEQGYTLHHDYTTDSDGNIWALATSINREKKKNYVEDQIIKIDSKTGKITKVIQMQKLLPALYKRATGIEKHSNNKGKKDVVHLNAIQMMNDNTILVSSRETSTIMKISKINSSPKLSYFIGDKSVWKGVGDFSKLLLKKLGNFTSQSGQHSIIYQTSSKLKKGQYYIYMFNNNAKIMDSRKNFDWSAFEKIDRNGINVNSKVSMYYKYLVDERKGTYKLIKSFKVPYSPYVSDVQEYQGHIIVASGQKNYFGEYTNDGNLIRSFEYHGKSYLTYRTFKYSFNQFYFE